MWQKSSLEWCHTTNMMILQDVGWSERCHFIIPIISLASYVPISHNHHPTNILFTIFPPIIIPPTIIAIKSPPSSNRHNPSTIHFKCKNQLTNHNCHWAPRIISFYSFLSYSTRYMIKSINQLEIQLGFLSSIKWRVKGRCYVSKNQSGGWARTMKEVAATGVRTGAGKWA